MFWQLVIKVLQSIFLSMVILTCLKGIRIYTRWLDTFPRKNLPPQTSERTVQLTDEQQSQIKEALGKEISEFKPGRLKRFFYFRRWLKRLFKQPEQLTPENHDRATDVMEFVERWGSALMFIAYFGIKLFLNAREWTK